MDTPALYKYGHMPRIASEIVEPVTLASARNWKPPVRNYGRWITISSEPRGSVRSILGISIAVALTLLIFITAGTLFPRLFEDNGVMFGFIASVFVASVMTGYFVSSLSIRRTISV
ncbi:MAG TPA: hypothetical protein VK779_07705 [Rhizomicrobium sp.]|jgi:hypothetical protein|nr:hypothetical protein [Rhizomicrobium sp.]